MIDEPKIVQTDVTPAATIHLTIPRDEIQNVMGPGIGELMSTVASQGIAMAGPIFSHHHKITDDGFDFDLGIPVAAPVSDAGRVTMGELPAAKVARTVYHGPYEGLGAAWGEFDKWIMAQGLKPAENLWEFYVAGPESSDDPANWRTELNRPITE